VSSKEGTFSKEGGHESQETFFLSFGPKYFSAVGGRTVCMDPYSRMDLAWKSRHFGHRISRQISVFCSLFLGRTEQFVQLTVGTENEAEGGRTTVRFWHEKRGRFLWDRFGAVRYFPWLEM
jgi:hypothetical protein